MPNGLANEVLRDVLIPSILGKQTSGILYWAGKDLARKFPVSQSEQLPTLFNQLGFGQLTLQKKNSKQQFWLLSGPNVADRLRIKDVDFNLETGFLAEQIQMQTNATTEAQISDQKKESISILVQHDLKEEIPEQSTIQFISIEDEDK